MRSMAWGIRASIYEGGPDSATLVAVRAKGILKFYLTL